ncbi:hypothetical protein AZSI13_12030 [Azospira sp. I13]|nr:hypothetical protein AZSI13_12030 [Azospira sp. I13]
MKAYTRGADMTQQKIGRFEIRHELGRGAQSVVYLAYDPQLEREIAIKTLHFSQPDPSQNASLLAEARTVSQLRHANVVPIFEAGEEAGDIYLVFQYIPGRNLAQHLKEAGPLSPVKAITLMRSVLDAVASAHEHGIIHRDLKPSNILLDEEGIPQVMDFGIAARVESTDRDQGDFTGTPAYMAPEYIHDRTVSVRGDVFAAGLILYELLTGHRAIQGNDPFQVMHHIANVDVRLPAEITLDERIVDILYKATARNPQQRYESISQFRQALEHYLDPEEESSESGGKQSTLEFLLRRMRHKSDFPALSESVSAINKIATSETESIARLSSTILKDFALTNKILRLVNSAYYRQAGGGNISTVSRAVIVLGFDAVRNIAITVLLFEHLQNKANAAQLKDEFLQANLAGILAKDVGAKTNTRDVEQAFICSMFHNLGRLLCQYYFPEESEEVKKIMAQKSVGEESASLQVLGMSYEELGIGVARTWGFPPLIVNSMRKLPAGNVRAPNTPEDKLRVLSAFSNELCLVIAQATPEDRARELKKLTARFGDSVKLDEREIRSTIERSITQVKEFASIIRLNLQQTNFGRQLRVWSGDKFSPADATATTESSIPGTVLSEHPGGELPPASAVQEGEAPDSAAAQAILTAGIQDISNTLVEDYKLNDILRIILETMYRAMGFKRVILCIKDTRNNTMQGRFGFGPETAEISKQFRFSLNFSPDIFHAAISKGVDILISDTNEPKIKPRIPDWFRKALASETFVLFPLTIKNNPVALIYADKDRAGEIVIPEKELSLLRTLRNQALLAIKQSI